MTTSHLEPRRTGAHDGAVPDATDQAALGHQRWARLIPIVFVTYSLAYLDRSNFSVGVAGGMADDLHITSGISALIGAAFFLGYFAFQIPGAVYAERRSVRSLIFWSLLAWGVLASVQGLLSSPAALIVVRFLIGAVEAAVLPAMVILLSRWFTRRERGRANTFLILGNPVTVLWLTVVSGYLIEATDWRAMFVIEGLPAVAWAFVFRALVQDHPEQGRWLADAERDGVLAELAAEQRTLTPVRGYGEAFRNRNVLLLSVQYLLWSVGVYGFVFWLPSMVSAASGVGIGRTGLISAIPYVLAVAAMVANGRLSDRAGDRSRFVWPWLLLGAVAFYGSYLVGAGHFWTSFPLLAVAGAAMYAPYGPYFAQIPEFLPRSVAGAAIALINSFGALGGFAGSYLVGWLNGATGGTDASFLLMAGCLAAAAALMLVVRAPRPEPAR